MVLPAVLLCLTWHSLMMCQITFHMGSYEPLFIRTVVLSSKRLNSVRKPGKCPYTNFLSRGWFRGELCFCFHIHAANLVTGLSARISSSPFLGITYSLFPQSVKSFSHRHFLLLFHGCGMTYPHPILIGTQRFPPGTSGVVLVLWNTSSSTSVMAGRESCNIFQYNKLQSSAINRIGPPPVSKRLISKDLDHLPPLLAYHALILQSRVIHNLSTLVAECPD